MMMTEKIFRILIRPKGQTLIETALILFLIMIILLGITEFSRAWFTKNSLKNAARNGARVAAVRTGLTVLPDRVEAICTQATVCPNSDWFINAVCCQPGVKPSDASVNLKFVLTVTDRDGSSGPAATKGDEVKVAVEYNSPNFLVVGDGIWPWKKSLVFRGDTGTEEERNKAPSAVMRYELN